MSKNNYFKKYKVIRDPPLYQEDKALKGGASNLQHVQTEGSQPLNEVEKVHIDATDFDYQNRMSIYNPSKIPYMKPSSTTEYTIAEGTILYHGTMTKESFNPFDIRLGDDNLVAYLSPNKKLATDYIVGCAIFPNKNGFIHKFRAKKPIDRLLILSTYEKKKQWNLKFIEDSFCSRQYRIQLNGIGFFYPKVNEIDFIQEATGDDVMDLTAPSFDSEFAICNPNEFLEYVSTQRCIASRKLSAQYRFNQ